MVIYGYDDFKSIIEKSAFSLRRGSCCLCHLMGHKISVGITLSGRLSQGFFLWFFNNFDFLPRKLEFLNE